ncbi:MAG: VWA domain-containing protein, partial [Spirochaetaceae bacterium]
MSVGLAQTGYLLLAPPVMLLGYLLYRRRKSPSRLLPILKTVPILLLVLALSDPRIAPPGPGTHTVYLIDASATIRAPQLSRSAEYVIASTRDLAAPESAAVLLFGKNPRLLGGALHRPAQVAEAISTVPSVRRAEIDPSATNIASAIREAVALLPAEGDRRVLLLSDGVETEGSGAAAASLLQEEGIRVSTVYLPREEELQELRVASVSLPREVQPGDLFELAVTIEGRSRAPATLRLYREEHLLGSEEIPPVGPGGRVLRYRVEAAEPGIARYRVELESEGDVYPENNSALGTIRIRGARPLLYIRDPGEPRPFRNALETQGYAVESASPETMERALLSLSNYEAVIIDDLPATRFPLSTMQAIERYVRDAGGGLITLGGPNSYGAGGYGQTPLEEALPVSVDITSTVQLPTLAMVFVVDKSGSMGNSGGGASKLDIVKEALLSSVEVMHPNQLVGLLSFDADVEWSVPITRAAEREEILRNVVRLSEGGGTVLGAAMREAARSLDTVEAATKHLIILSDGLTREADFIALTRRLRTLGATVSTVSIGRDADKALLESIAREGFGRYYHTDDTTGIPRIFTEETSVVARNVVVEETFFPRTSDSGEILSGIPESSIPPLRGFVMTYPKSTARQLMNAPEGQPLLTVWQYGLGRSAAFTSSVDGLWGGAWSRWELLPRLAGQLVRWTSRPTGAGEVELVHAWKESGILVLTARVRDVNGRGRNGLALQAIVNGP